MTIWLSRKQKLTTLVELLYVLREVYKIILYIKELMILLLATSIFTRFGILSNLGFTIFSVLEIWARLPLLFLTASPNYLDNLKFWEPVAPQMLIVIMMLRVMLLTEDVITLANTLKSVGGTTCILLHQKVCRAIFRTQNSGVDCFQLY